MKYKHIYKKVNIHPSGWKQKFLPELQRVGDDNFFYSLEKELWVL